MLSFIDFRKAFDLEDLAKIYRILFHYLFDNDAFKLVSNYFQDRKQIVKFNGSKTEEHDIK